MITTTIVQVCNGCQVSRTLENDTAGSAQLGGWREVRHTKHLCPLCIKKALKEI